MAFATFDPAHDEDGLTIVMHEPRESWRANVTWGLLLGLPAVSLPFLEGDASFVEKWGTVLLGIGWLAFMGTMAWRNFGRTVRCDTEWITVSQAFAPKRIPLAEVASITREDSLAELRKFEEIGMSRQDRIRRFDTRAPVVMYVLRDAQGRTLLRLDKDMEPAEAMGKFIARIERQTGRGLRIAP